MWRSTDNGATWTQVIASHWPGGWPGRGVGLAMPDGSIVLIGGSEVWRFVPTGSSEKNPTHTYIAPGIYRAALQVYNSDG